MLSGRIRFTRYGRYFSKLYDYNQKNDLYKSISHYPVLHSKLLESLEKYIPKQHQSFLKKNYLLSLIVPLEEVIMQ